MATSTPTKPTFKPFVPTTEPAPNYPRERLSSAQSSVSSSVRSLFM